MKEAIQIIDARIAEVSADLEHVNTYGKSVALPMQMEDELATLQKIRAALVGQE
jgi:hypothetical protein